MIWSLVNATLAVMAEVQKGHTRLLMMSWNEAFDSFCCASCCLSVPFKGMLSYRRKEELQNRISHTIDSREDPGHHCYQESSLSSVMGLK